jgi:hypothetical protein
MVFPDTFRLLGIWADEGINLSMNSQYYGINQRWWNVEDVLVVKSRSLRVCLCLWGQYSSLAHSCLLFVPLIGYHELDSSSPPCSFYHEGRNLYKYELKKTSFKLFMSWILSTVKRKLTNTCLREILFRFLDNTCMT